MADEAERFAQRATQLVEQRARDAEDFTQKAGAYVMELSKGSQSDPAQSSPNAQAAAEFETKARALVEKTEAQKVDEIMRQRGLPVSDKALRGRIIAELRNTGTVPDSFQETPNGPGHLFTSLLPEPALNAIGNVPVVGPTAEDVIGGATSPLGLMTLPGAPARITAKALGGSVVSGVLADAVAGEGARSTSVLPQPARDALRKVPGAGPLLEALTTPMGLGGLAGPVAPGLGRKALDADITQEAFENARLNPERGSVKLPNIGSKPLPLPDIPETPLPPIGDSAARKILATKEATLLKPGVVTQLPGVKRVVGGLNPSVDMPREILVAANAKQAVQASLADKFAAIRKPVLAEIKAAAAETPPRYIGPPGRRIAGELADVIEHPADYQLSPRMQEALALNRRANAAIFAEPRGQYGVEAAPYTNRSGGDYVPHFATRESLDDAAQQAMSDLSRSQSISKTSSVTKHRAYDTLADRMATRPDFKPELNIDTLYEVHDNALARLAGSSTFRIGAGGKTKLEVMQETHPALAKQMVGLRRRLETLRGTYGRLNEDAGAAIDDFLRDPEGATIADLADALDVRVGGGTSKPLQHSSFRTGEFVFAADRQNYGQVVGETANGQVRVRFWNKSTGGQATVKLDPGLLESTGDSIFGMTRAELNKEIRAVRQQIKELRPAWQSADTSPYIRSNKTFLFHTPDQARSIDTILQTKLGTGDSILGAIDEFRMTRLAADASPISVQGGLGLLFDPVTTIRNLPKAVDELATGRAVDRILQTEPEMAQRFSIAGGRRLGEAGAEFQMAKKGLERVPGMASVNNRLMGFFKVLQYESWKTKVGRLEHWQPNLTQAQRDAEAYNTVSKIIPSLNPLERGVSPVRARLEGAPVVSTSFIGAPATLLKDATSGLVKLATARSLSPAGRWQSLAGREQLAIVDALEFMGVVGAASYGSYMISGYSPEEWAKKTLDPNSPRFMSVAMGKGGYIPLGGPVRSFVRAIYPSETVGVVPVPFSGIMKYARGKVTPIASYGLDLARNKDYFGRTIMTGDFPANIVEAIAYGVESLAPLTGGAAIEALRTGGSGMEALKQGALQLGGQSYYETSATDKLAEAWNVRPDLVEDMGKFNPDDATQWKFAESDPELSGYVARMREQGLERGSKGAVTADRLDKVRSQIEQKTLLSDISKGVLANNPRYQAAFPKAWDEYQTQMAGAFEDAYFGKKTDKPATPQEAAYQAWIAVRPQDYFDHETAEIDWAAYEQAKDKAFEALPKPLQDTINAALKSNDPEVRAAEAQFKKARDLKNEFYEKPKYVGLSPAEGQELDLLKQSIDRKKELDPDSKGAWATETILDELSSRFDAKVVDYYRENFMGWSGSGPWAQSPQDPARDEFLLAHPEILRFYPTLANNLSDEQKFKLPNDIILSLVNPQVLARTG